MAADPRVQHGMSSEKRVELGCPPSVHWTESVEEVTSVAGRGHRRSSWLAVCTRRYESGSRRAAWRGKSVVTANKQLMAHHGTELLDLARRAGSRVRFEASVAGGIPVLRALQEGLARRPPRRGARDL